MRLTVIHDASGRVSAIVAQGPNGVPAGPAQLEAGDRITEIDVPEITSELADDEVFARLSDLAENYIVDGAPTAPRLARKTQTTR